MFVTFIVYLTTCSANCIGFLECHLSPGAPHLFHNDRDLFEMNDELLGYRSFSLCVVCAVSYFPIFLYYNIFITRKKGYFFFFPKRLISVFTHWFSLIQLYSEAHTDICSFQGGWLNQSDIRSQRLKYL